MRARLFLLALLLLVASSAQAQSDPPLAAQAVASMSQPAVSAQDQGDSRTDVAVPDLFTGTLTTELPLQVPEGRGGMTPHVTLRYRSTHANSWIGAGWDLRMGAIERDIRNGLDFGADKFVLDDGTARTTLAALGGDRYAAQIEEHFFRIRRLTGDSGPYFEVTTTDGTQYIYGSTAASRLDDPADGRRVFSWMLESVRDTRGNRMQYEYVKTAQPAREMYLAAIRYASNDALASLTAPHLIEFIRAVRTDVVSSFTTGFRVQMSQVLQAVEISSLGVRQRRYELNYERSATAGAMLLSTVTQVGRPPRDGQPPDRLPPTQMKYASESGRWTFTKATGSGPVLAANGAIWAQCLAGDYDGDGRTDVACNTNNPGEWHVGITSATGFAGRWGQGGVNPEELNAGNKCFSADLDGDGNTDIACYLGFLPGRTHGRWSVALSTGSGWNTTTFDGGPHVAYPIGNQCLAGDFNGDGKADLTCYTGPGSHNWHTVFSTGRAFTGGGGGMIDVQAGGVTTHCVTGDFNGDSRSDVACYVGRDPGFSRGQWQIATWATDRWKVDTFTGSGPDPETPITDQCLTGDFNGDGKTDLACYTRPGTNGQWHVSLSTGSGWADRWGDGGIDIAAAHRCVAGDFNGDLKTDIACLSGPIVGNWYLAYSTGSSWSMPRPVWFGPVDFVRARERCFVGEYRRYARSEILCSFGPPGWNLASSSVEDSGDLLTDVAWSGGARSHFTWGSSIDTRDAQIGFGLPVLRSASVSDGRGVTSTTTFDYEGGFFNRTDHEFRGFNLVHIAGPAGPAGEQERRDVWFHQGNEPGIDQNDPSAPTGFMKGRIYRDRSKDEHDVRKHERTIVYRNADGPSRFQPPIQFDDMTCEDNTNCSHTVRAVLSYDRFGNIETAQHVGDVSDPTDDWEGTWTFVPNEDRWIVDLPASYTVKQNGLQLARTEFFYDGVNTCEMASTIQQPVVGNLTRAVRWLENGKSPETLMGYNQIGRVVCVRDPNGGVTRFTYDPTDSFVTKLEDALGNPSFQTHFEPDHLDAGPYGEIRTLTDPNKQTIEREFDGLGRLEKILLPDEGWIEYAYEDTGNPERQRVTVTSKAGLTATSYLDGRGRNWLRQVTGPDRKTINYRTDVDARGLVVRADAPFFDGQTPAASRTYQYDALQRLTRVTNPDGTFSQFCFDGFTKTAIDENRHASRSTVDAFADLVSVEEFDGDHAVCDLSSTTSAYAVTKYHYDAFRRLVSTKDAKDHEQAFAYDTLGLLTTLVDPSRGKIQYIRDANGNITEVIDAAGQHTFYHPDGLNRLLQIDFLKLKPQGAGDYQYSYDSTEEGRFGIGRLASTKASDTQVTLKYDKLGRVAGRTYRVRNHDYTFLFAHDYAGRVVGITYPDNSSVRYEFDGSVLGRVYDKDVDFAKYSDYDALERPGTTTLGNQATITRTYYSTGNQECPGNTLRLCREETRVGGRVLDNRRYSYDGAGNTTQIQAPQWTVDYTYDPWNRLRSSMRAPQGGVAATTTFEYDQIGNITKSSSLGPYTYGQTQPYAVTSVGNSNYSHDARGNMKTSPGFSFTFNAMNQLVEARQTDGNILRRMRLQFVYAGTGERVAVKDGLSWKLNIGDTYRCTGSNCAKVVYGAGGPVGTFSASSQQYVVADRLGSTIDTLDRSGQIVQQFDYRPFGSSIGDVDKAASPYLFTGKERDRSGLYYYGARYYDPVIGRFLSPDPLPGSPGNPASLNPYSYAQNNPLRFVDPTGMKVMDDGGGFSHENNRSGPTEHSRSGPEVNRVDKSSSNDSEQEPPDPEPGDPTRPEPNSSHYDARDRWREWHEPPEPVWNPPPPSPGGAPNFEPFDPPIVSQDPVTTAAKLYLTWFIARGPAFEAQVRNVAAGRFEAFAFVGTDMESSGTLKGTGEWLGLAGYSGASNGGLFYGRILAGGPKIGTSTNYGAALIGDEWVRSSRGPAEGHSTGIKLFELGFGEEIPGVEGGGLGLGTYIPEGEHWGVYGFGHFKVFGKQFFFGGGGATWQQ